MKHFLCVAVTAIAFLGSQDVNAQCGPVVNCPSNIVVNNSPGICGAVVNYSPATATTTCTGAVTVYSETFQSGAGAWTLNVNSGTNMTNPNSWEVNATEGGVVPPGCGVANNGDLTLHITCTSAFCGSLLTGAIYNAARTSNKRAESPAINTTGYTGLTLNFNYISMGDGLNDNASVLYNDGSGWQVLTASIKSLNCVSGQGQWTAYSAALPASCDNNPALQIGFNWTNNNDNIGTDPSVAINDITITTSAASPVPTITYNFPSGTQFPVGTTTVVATATDFLNNTNTCSFLVTVNDVEAPVLNCPANMIVPANNAGCTAIVNWNATATDNCSVTTLTSNYTSGSSFPLGTTTVIYNASDSTGNSVTCSFDITVTNPAITIITSTLDSLVCEDATDTLVATGAATYSWSTGATSDTILVTHAIGNTQWIVVGTDANGCTDADTVSVVVSPLAVIDMNMTTVDTQCVSNASVSLNGLCTPVGGVWSGPGVNGNTFDPSVAGAGTHVLTYAVANQDSCMSYALGAIYVDNCLLINSTEQSPVLVYPNPNKGNFVIELSMNAQIEVYSSTGEIILSQKGIAGKNYLSMIEFPDGIYLIRVEQGSSAGTVRILKSE